MIDQLDLQDFYGQRAEMIAWNDGHVARTFETLFADVSALGQRWREAGVPRGARLIVHGLNAYETWLCALAAYEEGCSLALLPSRLRVDQLDAYCGALSFDFQISPSVLRGTDAAVLTRPHRVARDTALPERSSRLRPEEPWIYIFTSGSSGDPKAVQHSARSLMCSARASLQFYEAQAGDSWLLSLDLAHIGGFQIALRCLLGGLVCLSGFEPTAVDAALRHQRISFLSLVPTQLHRLLEDPLSIDRLRSCRAILLGGAACPPALLDRLRTLDLPVSITYGSSETASQVAAWRPGYYPAAGEDEDVGTLLPIWEAAIEEGCLTLRGEALCQGWWQTQIFSSARSELGRYRSTDRAVLKGSHLCVLGRDDQVFQVGGENLAPAEIAAALGRLPVPGDWLVLPFDDEIYGQVPVLVYRGKDPPPSRAAVYAMLGSLPRIKWPRRCYWHQSADVHKPSRADYARRLATAAELELVWTQI